MPKKKEIAAPECSAHHGDVVKEVEAGLTSSELLAEMAGLFKGLSDPTRLKIINALLLAEMCVCDITAMMRIPQPSVSHHLKELRLARLVKCRKNGKEIAEAVHRHAHQPCQPQRQPPDERRSHKPRLSG